MYQGTGVNVRSGIAVLALLAIGSGAGGAEPEAGLATAPPELLIAPTEQLDEVTVEGRWKGPQLWRIRRGDHVLWLLGTPELLPEKMQWESSDVAGVLATAGELVMEPRFDARLGYNVVRLARLYREWRRVRVLPDGVTLADVLDHNWFARLEAQRQRLLPGDSLVVRQRPLMAMTQLFEADRAQQRLRSGRSVGATVEKLARAQRMPVTRATIEIRTQDVDAVLKQLAGMPGAAEVNCLKTGIESLETDQGTSALRARAWAVGDVATLRKLVVPNVRAVCTDVLSLIPSLQAALQSANQQWLDATHRVLNERPISFAVRSIEDILAPDGVLKVLRDRGDVIEGP